MRQCPTKHVCVIWLGIILAPIWAATAHGQAGFREALERLDTNDDGEIDPHEVTPLARPYLQRIINGRRKMTLDRSIDIEDLQEAARIYFAERNGVSGVRVVPDRQTNVRTFEPTRDQKLVPEFGLAEVKYPYVQDDLEEADDMLRRSDRNRDGYIDRSEARRARWSHVDPFQTSDFNKDDRLSRMELAQRYARRRMLSGSARELGRKAAVTGNGIRPTSTRRRSRSSSGGNETWLTSSIMSRFDSNRDGILQPDETDRLGIPAAKIDADRDQQIARDELLAWLIEWQDRAGGAAEGLPGWFYTLDLDGDGQVALHEYTSGEEWRSPTLFKALDLNSDGLVTPAEAGSSAAMVGGTYRSDDAELIPPRKTIISEIEVEDDYPIRDLNLRMSITHSNVGYLDAYLTAPDGTRVELFTEVGDRGNHFEQTVFDDEASTPITKSRPPYRGTFQPEGHIRGGNGLRLFRGKTVKGVWQLIIRGTRNDRFGMLHDWSLLVEPQEQSPSLVKASDAGSPQDADGRADDESAVESDPKAKSTATSAKTESGLFGGKFPW